MKIFAFYLEDYFRAARRKDILLSVFFVSLLIFLNYTFGIESLIISIPSFGLKWFIFFVFYLLVFSIAYSLQSGFSFPGKGSKRKLFLGLILAGAGLFALKITPWPTSTLFSWMGNLTLRNYFGIISQPPLKLAAILILLFLINKYGLPGEPIFGFSRKGFSAWPYLFLLLLALPFLAYVSSQPAFLQAYPKFRNVSFIQGQLNPGWCFKILYEISYGLDFVTIEVFFRGFMVLAFARIAGINAILPMAIFYCTIHFGKPMAECISSFFGGVLLGVFVFNSKSIWGGLILHLGIAWGMECAGFIRMYPFHIHP